KLLMYGDRFSVLGIEFFGFVKWIPLNTIR
ncbi:MAG: hypothetical protein ACI83W_002450, partial [Marinoscillum sp.]